jgi:Transposase
MSKSKHSEAQIIAALKQVEAGRKAEDVARECSVLSQMPPLLLELWRVQHPLGHEQTTLNFNAKSSAAETAPLFRESIPHEVTQRYAFL